MPAIDLPSRVADLAALNKKFEGYSGADLLRHIVRNMDTTAEYANDDLAIDEIVAIHIALLMSEWDFYPDQWTEAQKQAAIRYGEPPRFDDQTERPLKPFGKDWKKHNAAWKKLEVARG